MNRKSLFGTAMAVLAVWFALGVSATVYADATFDGCTLYSRVKVGNGGATTTCAPINTGFMPSGTTSIDAKYRMHNVSVNSCLFCARTATDMGSGGPHFNFFPVVSSKPRWDYNSTSPVGASNTTVNPNYRLIVESGKATLYTTLDRVLMEMSVASSTFAAKFPMFLFASYTGTTPGDFNNCGQYYFYYLKAYDGPIANGKLQHHYVPCKTSEGKVGVADLVEEKVLLPSQNQSLLVVDENDSLGPVRPMIDASAFSAFATFTASGYEGSEELEEFPTLVRLAENSPEGFSYDDCSADGSDIRFADAEGHLIAHEIDTWDPAGESLIWVNVPKLTAETQFRMYIGGDGSAPTLPSSSVWRRAGYHFVDHNNVISSTAGADSTGSGLVGVKYSGDLAVAAVEGAPMGKADDQTNSHGWTVVKDAKWSAHGGQVTISCWSYRTDVTTTTGRQLMGVKGAYYLKNNTPDNNKLQLGYNSTDLINVEGPVKAGNWMQISGVMNGTEYKLYQNGVLLGSKSDGTAIADAADKLSFGSEYVGSSRNKGYLDEYRLRWGSSSADWVKAEYDTVMKAGFLEGVMGAADVPVPEDWEYSFAITPSAGMKSALGSGEEVNFPVLVRLSEAGISGFKYSDFNEADYGDLVFVDKDGKFLDYEVDTWDASGTSLVWVRVPSLTAASTITCRYSGPKYKHKPEKTWAGYIGVWHMNEADGNAVDATGHGLNGVPTGFNTALMVSDTTAPTGRGRVNQTATGSGTGASNRLSVPNYNDFITDHSKFTLSGWFKSTDKTGYPRPLSRKTSYSDGSGWEVQYDSDSATSVSVRGSDGSAAVTMSGPDVTADWLSLAFVFNGTTEASYANGGETSQSGTVVAVKTRNDPMAIGNNSNGSERGWCGMYDEVRLYNGVMSAARVKADYLVIKEPSALVYATVVAPDPELPKLANVSLSVNEAGDVVVSGDVLRHAGVVTVTLLAEGQTPVEIALGEVAAGDSFSRTVTEDDGLVKFQNYTASVSAANGEKVSTKQISDPVKYGKVTMVDMNYRIDVTVPEGFTTVPLENFPLLVRLSTAISGFAYSQFQNDGKDLMVFDEEGNRIPCELENWDAAGESRLWVQVPVVTNGTKVIVCYGLSGTVEPLGGMWSEYASVLHMNEEVPGGSEVKDSTGNAVPVLNTQGASDLGVLGGGFTMGTVTGKNGACVTVPVSAKLDECNGVFTASAWTKMNAAPGWGYLMGRKDSDKTASWGLQFRGADGNADGLALYTAGTADSQQSLFKTLTCFTIGAWVKWTAVYNGTDLALYLNGVEFAKQTTAYGAAVNGTLPLCIGGFPTTTNTGTLPAVFDEARVKIGAAGGDWIAAEYRQETDALPLIYSEVGPTDPNAPIINEPVLTPNDDGTFHMSVTITDNMPLEGSVKMVYGGAVTVLSTSDIAVPATYEYDITPTAEDVTSVVTVRAKSQLGSSRSATSSGFYNGELKIEKVCDAVEKGLSNGIWRISRADAAHELKVALDKLDTSIATAGVDYVEFPLAAVIPEGTNSVDVIVTPIMNLEHDYDTWVDLAITNGAYRIDSVKFAARCKIINYEIPTGGNIWCATAPGKASVASNWTMRTVPDENSSVMFDGDVSQADCEWDVDATHTLKSWTQMANYRGTVTIDTTYDEEFPELVINGDVIIGGGKWTHKGNYANFGGTEMNTEKIARKYRIVARVGGNLYLCAGASIDVTERGWGYVLPKQQNAGKAACHGGWMDNQNWSQEVCGDHREPTELGTGAISQGDWSGKSAIGGGAVKLVVGGEANLEGDLLADGTADTNGNTHRVTGSGGSIWVSARQISGAGRISTSTSAIFGNDKALTPGTGGRMALYTEEPLAKSREKLFCSGVAFSKTGSSTTKISGPGTIFIKDSTMSAGMLYVKQPSDVCGLSNTGCSTPVTGNWAFDKIILSGAVQLRVLPGFSLSVPSLDSIVSEGNTSAKSAVVVPFGAQFNCGAGNFVLKSGIALTTEEYTLDGNLILEPGAKLGAPESFYSAKAGNCDSSLKLTVSGDVVIPAGASAGATRAVALSGSDTARYGAHGGQSLWAFAKPQTYASTDGGYDSILNPSMPGYSQTLGFFAGGAFTLDVGGTLYLDGIISADGGNARGNTSSYDGSSAGSGGTVNITAGTITGNGSISANGGCGAYNYAGGAGGGRIAVCLTDEDAEFSDRWVNSIRAMGISFTSASANARAGSAGTVYLVDGSQAFDHGTIYVRNDMSFARADLNTAVTCIPGVDETCDNAGTLANTSLYLDGAARVKLTSSLEESILKVVNKTKLDLNGMVYTVRRAFIGDKKVPVGTYQSGDDPFGDILDDSTGGGMLRVTGYGLWVFIQ